MESIREILLEKVKPTCLAGEGAGWQQQKSDQTRVRLFEAAIACLVEGGYTGLSINHVCTRSGISRGALHHHFAEKMHLVEALTEYLFYRRMERFITGYCEVLDSGDDFVPRATELHWKSMQTREYAAYVEIANAARTDRQLAEIFIPLSERFDRAWHEEMVRAFPQWRERLEKLQLVSDFVMSAHLGLLLNRELFGSKQRVRQVYDLITETVVRVHHGDMSAPPPAPLSPRHSD